MPTPPSWLRSLLVAALTAALLGPGPSPATAQDDGAGAWRLLATADTEGHVDPCRSCPATRGEGGLARRATLLGRLREGADPAPLLVDAGNALFGGQSLASEGRVAAAAHAELAYDAMNLGFRDFRLGKEPTLRLVRDHDLPAISANLVDADTGERLVDPWVVRTRGDTRIAVLGLTERPAGLDRLPHLREQLDGVEIRSPIRTLAEVLPEARAEADEVVLAYYGSPVGLSRLLRSDPLADPGAIAALAVGGIRPADLPEEVPSARAAPWPVVASHAHGTRLASVTPATSPGGTETETAVVSPDLPRDEGMVETLRAHRPEASGSADEAADRGPRETLPPAGEVGLDRTVRLAAEGESRGLAIRVIGGRWTDAIGERTPRPGHRFLVLETEWENRIAYDLVFDLEYAEALLVASVPRQLVMRVDGHILRRPTPPDDLPDGGIEEPLPAGFTISGIGSMARGNVVFEVPTGTSALELRYYHDEYAPVTVPLMRTAGGTLGPAPAPTDLDDAPEVRSNEVAELAVYGVETRDEVGDRSAPDGSTFAVVDLRGRSKLSIEADARALDREAPADERLELGKLLEYLRADQLVQLVSDGEHAVTLEPDLSSMPAPPTFLPDLWCGGRLVFRVPREAASRTLECHFPQLGVQGQDVTQRASILFPLEGTPPDAPSGEALGAIPDEPISLRIEGRRVTDAHVGERSPDGGRFLVLDVAMENEGDEPGLMPVAERFGLRLPGGTTLSPDRASFRGPRRLVEPLYFPVDARRTFELVFRVPADAAGAILTYGGISRTGSVEIDLPGSGDGEEDAPETTGEDEGEGDEEAATEDEGDGEDEEPSETTEDEEPSETTEDEEGSEAAETTREPQGLAGVGLTAEEVNEAIDRGRDFLWDHLQEVAAEDGRPVGGDAEDIPALLALVHCDAHEEYPAFDEAVRTFLEETDHAGRGRTYQRGLICMLIDAYGDPSFYPDLRTQAKCLVETQGPDGSWRYGSGYDPTPETSVLGAVGGFPVPEEQTSGRPPALDQLERETPVEGRGGGDNSVTQFAVLGLRAAERRGFRAPEETWRRVRDLYRERQDDSGGWGYRSGGVYGSMTCAGISSILVANWALDADDPADEAAIDRGIAWLDEHFSVSVNPSHDTRWVYYYLYSLERTGRLLDREFIGEHEWYPLGARQLVDAQRGDGSWIGPRGDEEDPRIATAFALLFLTRATEELDVTVETGGEGTLRTRVQEAASPRVYFILDASGSMRREVEGRSKFELAREAILRTLDALPENAEVALRVYGHRRLAIDEGADEDTNLEVRMGSLGRNAVRDRLAELGPRGRTPLTLSLEETLGDLGRDATTVVLLTDGGDDTRRDPVEAARGFADTPHQLHVVGFDINRADWTEQLHGMAGAAGGVYWSAGDAEGLAAGMRQAALHIPESWELRTTDGEAVAEGRWGEEVTLPEGEYVLRTAFGDRTWERSVWVNTNRSTGVVLRARHLLDEEEGEGD